jgi:hypothetical protein
MRRSILILGGFLLPVLSGMDSRAGFDWNLITKSAQEEKNATHIFVGRLIAFHEIKTGEQGRRGRTLPQFVAEVAVYELEKGEGIASRSRIYVRFSSPKTKEQLETERVTSGCGDEKIDPIPGEDLRLYVRLNENYEYVADYPRCFFSIGRWKAEERRGPLIASSYFGVGAPLLLGALLGFYGGLTLRAGRAGAFRPRKRNESQTVHPEGIQSSDQPVGSCTSGPFPRKRFWLLARR